MSDPQIDIFLPYWGDPGYAKQAIDSVLAQTSRQWRLTVVDDAYPGTEVADYVSGVGHPQVRYQRHPHNIGITDTFAECIASAEAPLVVVLGCDDRLLPDYVDKVLQAHHAHPEAGIIQPGVQVIDAAGRMVRTLADDVKSRLVRPSGTGYRQLGGERLAASLLTGDWLYWPSLAFDTRRVQQYRFRPGFPVIQDLALIMDMVFAGERLLVFDDECFQYRRHRRSASSVELSEGLRFEAERRYFALAGSLAIERGWPRAARAARARLTSRAHALTLVPQALTHGEWGTVGRFVRHALGS